MTKRYDSHDVADAIAVAQLQASLLSFGAFWQITDTHRDRTIAHG